MTPTLQPGVLALEFTLPAANLDRKISLSDYNNQKVALLFFPAAFGDELAAQLEKYQGSASGFEEQGAALIGISSAPEAELKKLTQERNITFPLLSDAEPAMAAAARYRILSEDGQLLPAVFVVDEGLIRRVYEPGKYPNLPNPAMVLRAIKKMADVQKPVPVSQEDWRQGAFEAPVVVIEYADYECKPCGEAYRLLKEVLPAYGDRVLWIHRHLPLRTSHPLAQQAAEAAEAAGAQGKFWEMHDRLFEAGGVLEREQLIEYARDIGLDVDRFIEDLDSRRYRDAVNEDFKQAVRNKIKLPPVLFINSIAVEGPRTRESICATIDSLLTCYD